MWVNILPPVPLGIVAIVREIQGILHCQHKSGSQIAYQNLLTLGEGKKGGGLP